MPDKPSKPLKPLKTPKPLKPLKPLKPTKPLTPRKPLEPQKPQTPLKPQKPLEPQKPLKPREPRSTELARETAKILALKEEIGIRFWDLGQCLLRVHDDVLYTQDGLESFEQYLEERVSMSRTSAYRLMDLARNFSRSLARKHGQAKLLAAIELAKATPEQDQPIDVLAYQIEVRGADGKMRPKPFEKASGQEIKRAAQRIRRRQSTKPQRVSQPSISVQLSWQTQALRALRAVAPRAMLEIRSGRGADPELSLTISGLPRSRLREALARLVRCVPEP
ncbi:MAG: hypothetical protein JXR96_26900 [Deltaproteobacteria bacterium]|nr:hypothetical protein [Deltaproteobacteria bacterium]